VRDALKSYLALAGGLTDVTRQRAVGAAKALVAQGEATAEQVGTLAEDLLAQSRSNREAVVALVKYEVDRTLGRFGLAAGDEVTELTKRVRSLEAQVRELLAGEQPTAAASAKPATQTSGNAAGAQPPAKPAAKKAAKKTAVKKAARKTTGTTAAKRTTAKKTAKRTVAKKATVKKAAAKKAPAKKAPAKRTTAKRAPAKKAAVRKTAKKTAAKKTAAKKTARGRR
jgi:polyhydroxyalkanoate synthesis regulator phasin